MLPTCSGNTAHDVQKRDRPGMSASDRSQRQVRGEWSGVARETPRPPCTASAAQHGLHHECSPLCSFGLGRNDQPEPLGTASAALVRFGRVHTRRSFTRPLRLMERLGELRGSDLDLETGVWNVERQWTKQGELTSPKSKHGIRRIPLRNGLPKRWA